MKLSVGKVAFPIEFDNGDKDTIYFNPNDPDLATRLMKAKDNIGDKLENLKADDYNLKNDGSFELPENIDGYEDMPDEQREVLTNHAESMTKLLESTKTIICEEIDTAFNGDISSVVFKHCSPLAVVNGEYFIIQFLNAITPEIQKNINKSNAEVEKKMSKHIAKYQKG